MPHEVIAICTESQKSFYQSILKAKNIANKIFTSEKQIFDYLDAIDFLDVAYLFIQLRLKWNDQAFFGFKLAERLRFIGLRCPFYFFTYHPKSAFDPRLPDFALLRVKNYHQLITQPIKADFWLQLNTTPMLEYKRQDIIKNLLNKESLVGEVLHELKNKLLVAIQNEEIHQIQQLISARFNELKLMFPQKEGSLLDAKNKIFQAIEPYLSSTKAGRIPSLIDSFKPTILNFIPKEERSETIEQTERRAKWKIILMDDEREIRRIFQELFKLNNMQCIVCNSGREVIELLKKDQSKNLFCVLICDIRMLEKGEIEWKDDQGYDVMWEVRHTINNFLELIALTSGRSRLLELLKDDQIKFHRMLKQDVLSSDGAKRMFVARIRELGEKMFFKSRSKPKQASWTTGNRERFAKPLAHYYREHLFSEDYEFAEEVIAETAFQYIKNVSQDIPNQVIEFTGTMRSNPPRTREGLQKFRDRILLGRRIALALYLHENKTDEEIYRIMMSKPEGTINEPAINQLLTTSLALSFKKDLPSEKDVRENNYLGSCLLEEEIKWLVDAFKISFNLKQIRISETEKSTIVLSLSDLQYSLKGKIPKEYTTGKELSRFLKFNFEKIKNIKTAKAWFKLAFSYAKEFGLTKYFKERIQEDLEEGFFVHDELKQHLVQYLDS